MTAAPLIALAEDNPDLRALFASALERSGYRVIQAATGVALVAAVAALTQSGAAPQLIITDVRMPALGGVEAARALREAGSRTPLIFMTAYGDAWSRSEAAALGAQLLDKPLSITELRRAVHDTLAQLAV
jgi:CheY-like chemotaxis protein